MSSIQNYWQWKVEPVSPTGYPKLDSEVVQTWGLFEDDEVQQQKKPQTITAHEHEKADELTRAEIASKLLQDLDEWIKEEPFSDWLEEKIDLPIFEELPGLESRCYGHSLRGGVEASKSLPTTTLVSITTIPSVTSVPAEVKSVPQVVAPQDTQDLLREFETVFGEVELTHGTLTPPQSPPVDPYTNIIPEDHKGNFIMLKQMVPNQAFQPIPSAPSTLKMLPTLSVPDVYSNEQKEPLLCQEPLEQMVPGTPSPDLVRELAAVDELVRTCVEDLVDTGHSQCLPDPWESCGSGNVSVSNSGGESEGELSMLVPPSPCTSSSGSSCGSGEEMCDDPEWIPQLVQHPTQGCLKNGRKRGGGTKPYSRPVIEEKRMRKKEQNKNAATRYRQKKKAEIEEILTEEKGLEEKNADLQLKISDLSREIKYLKGLMRDLFRAKGLMK